MCVWRKKQRFGGPRLSGDERVVDFFFEGLLCDISLEIGVAQHSFKIRAKSSSFCTFKIFVKRLSNTAERPFSTESSTSPYSVDRDSVRMISNALGKRSFLSIDFPTGPSNPRHVHSRIVVLINCVPAHVGPVQIAEGGAAQKSSRYVLTPSTFQRC